MPKCLLLLFIGFEILTSCHENKRSIEGSISREELNSPNDYITDQTNMVLGDGNFLFDSLQSYKEEDLYGRFFDNRAEYFIDENPGISIFNSKVTRIISYYLDGELFKTKYVVQDNLSNLLIDSYGNFKIIPYDSKNRRITEEKKVLINRKLLNDHLDNYKLIWKLRNKSIEFSVRNQEGNTEFELIEVLGNYESRLQRIQGQF